MSSATAATTGVGTVYPSGARKFTPVLEIYVA